MAHLSGEGRARYVREMFSRIAHRYDLLNRVMTLGQDLLWRRQAVRRGRLPARGRVLDLGAGTGDLGREILRQRPWVQLVAVDFNVEMMRLGRQKIAPLAPPGRSPAWCQADARHLPFAEGVFDAVLSAFLLRNLGDLEGSLQEQRRVLKPGGWLVALEVAPPPAGLLRPLILYYINRVIPLLGGLLTGQAEAYRYLPASTVAFLEAERLVFRLRAAGFERLGFERFPFGVAMVCWGQKGDA